MEQTKPSELIVSTYEVYKPDEGFKHFMLMINGSQANCPFMGAIPMQSENGQLGFAKQPCTTECPLATLTQADNGQLTYTVNCGNHPHSRTVTEKQKTIVQPVGGILKLM